MEELYYYPQEKDFDEIIAVWEASVRATHTFLSEEDIVFFKPLIRNEYLQHVNLICTKNKNGNISAFMGVNGSHLEMLFIDPASRGLGIGKSLVNHAIQNLGVRFVDVNEQNEQAVGFYYHMGFELISRDELDGTGKPFPILHLAIRMM
ncbi:acetyltransferase [Bacteroides sp. 51]|uniref:acetyltransferase n=1 Tax=Bacteroides sp. 51 TaxID=2302938 RepID=UPI0013D8DEC8|nr:acetyltransferase [Bacteroides sp. 51]NDV83320.1 acetyltransferase [Bacteroides sp. 51]